MHGISKMNYLRHNSFQVGKDRGQVSIMYVAKCLTQLDWPNPLTLSHSPFRFSSHNVISSLPPPTASTFPFQFQLTRHISLSNGSMLHVHSSWLLVLDGDDALDEVFHIRTVLSADADAM